VIDTMKKGADILASDAEVLVMPCNCTGIGARGLSLQFVRKWPGLHIWYTQKVTEKRIKLARCAVWQPTDLTMPIFILFPTRVHWRDPVDLANIKAGLAHLAEIVKDRKIRSIAIPAFGCHNGKLRWGEVSEAIMDAFADADCEVEIYPPHD
jgi:O-acetyl-ADP-ribose deacetylase (regulator of RNase III)